MEQRHWGYVFAALAGAIVGAAADRQYLAYQMSQAFAGLATPFASGSVATFGNNSATEAKTFEGLKITAAAIGPENDAFMGGPPLVVSVKNESTKTFERLSFGCAVKSPSRTVAWATCSDVSASISGGLAPGETQEIKATSFGGLIAPSKALKAHPDAQLTVFVTDARVPD